MPCSSLLSVAGLTESGEKIRVGKLEGMLGTTGLAVWLAAAGEDTRVVVGAASGSVRVSTGLVLGVEAVTRFGSVMKPNGELTGAMVLGVTVVRDVGVTGETPDRKSDELGIERMLLVLRGVVETVPSVVIVGTPVVNPPALAVDPPVLTLE